MTDPAVAWEPLRRPMRVLVATDGSESAAVAVDLVAGLPWPEGSTVRVVQAVESGAALFGGPWPAAASFQTDRIETELRRAAEEAIAAARTRLERPGLTVRGAVLDGRPAVAIADEATVMDADVVVVGSRGHGAIGSVLLGSVSSEVIDHAPVPVLVARRPQVRSVILAWDGSTAAERAAGLLGRWPVFAGVPVRVVSVTEVRVPWWTGFPEPGVPAAVLVLDAVDAARQVHERLAREMADRLRAAGLAAEADHREGDAATTILAAAHDAAADLIVMGTHGRSGIARLVLGSVARKVLHHADVSVLVVREG